MLVFSGFFPSTRRFSSACRLFFIYFFFWRSPLFFRFLLFRFLFSSYFFPCFQPKPFSEPLLFFCLS